MDQLVKFDEIEDAWLGLNQLDYSHCVDNPLTHYIDEEVYRKHPGALETTIFRNPDYIGYTAWCILGVRLDPFQQSILAEMWRHPFPMLIGSRGMSKSYMLGIYSLLRAVFFPEYKVILAGASFRQSKMIYDYVENFWSNAPVLRSMCSKGSGSYKDVDRWQFKINNSVITAIPIGPSGDKVRGLRANCVIADEFASHNPQIVEEVIFGFGATNSSPMDNVMATARQKAMSSIDVPIFVDEKDKERGNQSIIAGTADYYFNHFYDYWKRYKSIINSKGDPEKLREIFPGGVPDAFDWRDFCVIRLPYSLLPEGFMSDKTIARAKSQMTESLYKKEYEAVFVEDSDGFFRRSLIERCVASDKNVKHQDWVAWCPETFDPVTRGSLDGSYVYGIDPASEQDNLAICILDNRTDHSRIVYSWTVNREGFYERKKLGYTDIDDYYHFIVRKIRDLMKVFPCARMGIDTQGGGYALIEALHNKLYLQENEHQIWTLDNKRHDTANFPGLHIIEEIAFINNEWLKNANYDLRKDMETRTLLFPRFDPATIELSIVEDMVRSKEINKSLSSMNFKLFDSLEDCVNEIEDLKNELTTVAHSRVGTGINARERWSVPMTRDPQNPNKAITGKKDRYTALLIANSIARKIRTEHVYVQEYNISGGLVRQYSNSEKKMHDMYVNPPDWVARNMGK